MRVLPIALLLLLTTSLLHAQSKSLGEQMGFSGPVRIIRIEAERTAANGQTGPRVPVQTVVLDEKGNALHHDMCNPDGSVKWKTSWGHDYDAQGREVKTYYYNADGALTNTGVILYDDKGRRAEKTQINPNGSINHVQTYFYDDKGNLIREVHRNQDGTARTSITRKYDANGRMTEETFYGPDGSLGQKSVFTYDDRGNDTSWTVTTSDRPEPVLMFKKSQVYDERGNVKETINYGADNSVLSTESFVYAFDERGNWIKRTTARVLFTEGRSQLESEVTYRTFTYF